MSYRSNTTADDKVLYNKNTLWHDKDESLIEKGAPWATPMEPIGRYAYPQKKGATKDANLSKNTITA